MLKRKLKRPSDLLNVLLRRHFRGRHIPSLLDDRFIQVLRQNDPFEDWPLEEIVPDRNAFFAFLQERWPVFLDRLAAENRGQIRKGPSSYGLEFAGPLELPIGILIIYSGMEKSLCETTEANSILPPSHSQ